MQKTQQQLLATLQQIFNNLTGLFGELSTIQQSIRAHGHTASDYDDTQQLLKNFQSMHTEFFTVSSTLASQQCTTAPAKIIAQHDELIVSFATQTAGVLTLFKAMVSVITAQEKPCLTNTHATVNTPVTASYQTGSNRAPENLDPAGMQTIIAKFEQEHTALRAKL